MSRVVVAEELGLATSGAWPLYGTLPPTPRLAVVGSRAAQRAALACVPAIVAAAGSQGHALGSGGALGVDAAVPRAALAAGLPQLAIVPCTPDAPSPAEHAGLFRALAAAPGSGVLFAKPAGIANCRGIFASRNSLVVAAAAALVVVQAQVRSGSWGTGRLALRRRLATAAVTGAGGCADLIAHGALALPREAVDMEAAVLAWLTPQGLDPPEDPPSSWPPALQWLAAALDAAGPRGLGLDDLVAPDQDGASGCTHAAAALLSAELLGLVIESPPGRYHLRRTLSSGTGHNP